MMSRKYSVLDDQIIKAIQAGQSTFNEIVKACNQHAHEHVTASAEDWRIIDRRLQELRKAGKITFFRGRGCWVAVGDEK